MKILHIKTLFGEVGVGLSDPTPDGTRAGYIARCEFSDGTSAINAVEAMLVAHASAGVDIESDAYITGLNATLEGIGNWDDEDAKNTNEAEASHKVITADTHDVEAQITFHFDYSESLNEHMQDEPMSVSEIEEWVLDDILETGAILECMKNLRDKLTVSVKPKMEPA